MRTHARCILTAVSLGPWFTGYEPFCEAIRDLFGNDVSSQDLKALFRKIALNPDAQVDWSEVSSLSVGLLTL